MLVKERNSETVPSIAVLLRALHFACVWLPFFAFKETQRPCL